MSELNVQCINLTTYSLEPPLISTLFHTNKLNAILIIQNRWELILDGTYFNEVLHFVWVKTKCKLVISYRKRTKRTTRPHTQELTRQTRISVRYESNNGQRNFVQAHNIYGRSFDTVSGTDLGLVDMWALLHSSTYCIWIGGSSPLRSETPTTVRSTLPSCENTDS